VIYEATLKLQGSEMAEELARKELIRKPSLQALDQLFQARAMNSKHKEQDIQLIQQTVRNAIGNRRLFICSSCGFKAKQHHWQCPACNAWESLPSEPTEINEIN
jgi:lipopolysaccharide biosynthesis regulator YciM